MLLDANNPGSLFITLVIVFIAILLRYFMAAGLFYYYYYVRGKNRFEAMRLGRGWKKNQLRKEIIWSMRSSIIFAIAGGLIYWMWQNGYTAIYLELSEYPLWYLPLSFIIIAFIHETYYYWVHRWMHKPKVFRKVHKVHHDSFTPSPWTSFSFHPWESILEAVILPLILIVLPINIYILGVYLVFMTISSVINHLDIEIYPQWFQDSKFGKGFIGATHHHFHHEEYNTNFGLYFTFWDRWMNTESKT
ncbi:C-5 sterol desaturase [Flavobacteriaceae bacterium MAR_2010_188]|nr:C-5 sterol desaturase [Flavobacteriaceae bacterium MAR_2010_188]